MLKPLLRLARQHQKVKESEAGSYRHPPPIIHKEPKECGGVVRVWARVAKVECVHHKKLPERFLMCSIATNTFKLIAKERFKDCVQ
ncbi:hypothetical protein JTE90_021179 [Oedothorax gibbosus]|uniref:Uncharacterized protein n=1 Tax=Oedothorax gibbosus TaxID=931172 RepID=A0AAV6V475_9ARAC|nr:hypothetical protein JTE90_021179 [Oedothorax gibbosus]